MEKLPLSPSVLEERIGYKYKNIQLLIDALTHSSFANEMKPKGETVVFNERLEFLGDSVLSIIVSDYLYRQYPDTPEGDLTRIRASAVCEKTLGKLAMELGLGKFMRLGHGEELSKGRERISILADAFEALLASIYLDSGSRDAVEYFLMPRVIPEIRSFIENGKNKDYKTLLQQIVQQERGEILEYVLTGESGPDHAKVFEIEARLNSNVIGHGRGRSKREAEQLAAKEALVLFGDK
ncbi:MAG: ribonuclease III [Clostridia bacterium]|nr:ribonuclease III [Clostridia bacterium]MBQ2709983.1 ribonuclease III [Clostridia bacterium]